MGVLDHLSDVFDCSTGESKHKKRKQLQTVEVRVKMDCEGCERKVRRYVDPDKVVARVAHRTGKKAELWPYVPYDVVAHPYAQGVYDKKAPAGYVRRADDDPQRYQLARASSTEVRYTTAFSDENPAACVVM
nr:heavy metal-associated isoprenylated plant protein 26-like [Ipomoea batatas]GMD05018.1 heavy metal-associated isoprenylated plant protein 26-like [Ipomoea batatas]GMD07033.1 heavy metal-associated isoprenylated plant protein 26-like [Ipomoea batatas]GMD08606.1 heavy metal-associated isoprenylated plant protein 26-like [Ipomoea batatas]GMD08608.1 heavy metal-associated isoprenylated plant protein 26-like [Ipomoea batatas]